METTRIKLKIGNHEFEAEGPIELVKEQFESFKNIISSLPTISHSTKPPDERQAAYTYQDTPASTPTGISKVMDIEGRVVSLTALPASTEDAALLIMLGQKEMRNTVSVTAQEIGDGLKQSGRPVPRVDRIMESAIKEALVLKTGIKRSTRYRLTNQGLVRAIGLVRELSAGVS